MVTGEVNVVPPKGEGPSRPMPDVSIVTPSRNQGRYLDDTIASVLDQEGDFVLDYIVVDGASTDDSIEILKRHERRLRSGDVPMRCRGIRFRWLSEADFGQSHALAKGLAMATGEIAGWLNSDDTYLPGALGTVCGTFARRPECSVVYGRAHYVDENGKLLGWYPSEPFSRERFAVVNFMAQPSTFFRRIHFNEVGGIDVGLHYVMDYDLWLRMSARGPFHYLEEALATYRLHGESKTVAARHAFENARECLRIVRSHFGWAPPNRVFELCCQWLRANLPSSILTKPPVAPILTAPLALAMYTVMNRGVRAADLRQLTPSNIRRLFEGQRLY